MAIIPNGTKFHGLDASVDTLDRGSAQLNAGRQAYTMQDIADTVNAGSSSSEVINGYLYQVGTDAPVVTIFQNTIGETITSSRTAAGTYQLIFSNSITVPNGFTFNCRRTYGGSTKKYIDGLVSWTGQGQPITRVIFTVWDGSGTPVDYDESSYLAYIYFELKVF